MFNNQFSNKQKEKASIYNISLFPQQKYFSSGWLQATNDLTTGWKKNPKNLKAAFHDLV